MRYMSRKKKQHEDETQRLSETHAKAMEAEKQRLVENLKKNNYNPYDNYIRTIVAGLRGERSGSGRERRSRWKEFDTNGDGKASREELAAIRKYESQAQEKP